MKIAILGYDIEGRASYDYFSNLGHELVIHDQNMELTVPEGAQSVLGDQYLDNLDHYDLLVRTAGLAPAKILAKNPSVATKITSHTNEFFKVSPTKNLIGITGSKGKGTTSTLVARFLEAAGHQVFLVGNIGVAALTILPELTAESWVVLELSSFQLIDIQTSPPIAACLMIVPEHLNWHADFNEYITAKAQLFAHQQSGDAAIYYANNAASAKIASFGRGQKIPYYAEPGAIVIEGTISIGGQIICATSELQLLGSHNWQNICAAITTFWQVSHNLTPIQTVLATFSGLEHRLEFVREFKGVSYYDDSFGTTPETAIVAMEAFAEPKVLILGGSPKGADFGELAEAIKTNNVRQIIIMGNTTSAISQSDSPHIKTTLEEHGVTNLTNLICGGGPTMHDVITAAQAAAEPGDIVLLSTACASFDMFSNYKDRGQKFHTAVQSLH